ncbi:hypothetical protein Ahy_A05g025097 [Arachis hypogaea]|uniref:Uncharacterized protein n=1 Tax=Arachis hypogaea TaxID=3818 RepID=A0A445D7Z6_ARAHY|nr:hypothetical protein Ahy_A05g025097 [Arachis hypogaea]
MLVVVVLAAETLYRMTLRSHHECCTVLVPVQDLDVEDEESDKEYIADSHESGSSDDDDDDEFILETPVDGPVRYLLPAPRLIPELSYVPSHYHTLDLDAMYEKTPYSNIGADDYNTNGEFSLIPDEKLWPGWHGACLRPNSAKRRKATGRPVSVRFSSDMDEVQRQERWCGLCQQTGYTRRGCPNQPIEDT